MELEYLTRIGDKKYNDNQNTKLFRKTITYLLHPIMSDKVRKEARKCSINA